MNDAIPLAIGKGGYQAYKQTPWTSDIYLDPLFWQALGKALGWKETECVKCGYRETPHTDLLSGYCTTWYGQPPCEEFTPETPLHHWHCFIDHLAEGKDTDEFFDQLLK